MTAPDAATQPVPVEDDEDAAERRALEAAIAEADADPREVPHEEVRAWLLQLADGEFDVVPPRARLLGPPSASKVARWPP